MIQTASGGFRCPEHQKTAGFERAMKNQQDLRLPLGLQIGEQIPAGDQIHSGERRVFGHVLSSKHAHVTNGLADLIAPVRLNEESLQALRRDLRSDGFRIETETRFFDAPPSDVSGEKLNWGVPLNVAGGIARRLPQEFEETDGN